MERLPITYYRLGQSVMLDAFPGKPAKIAEINTLSIGIFFGPDLKSAWRLQSVSPEFVKPILRPLSRISQEHMVCLYRRKHPQLAMSDKQILEYIDMMQQDFPRIVLSWAQAAKYSFWLADLGYDMQGLIEQNLAVAEADQHPITHTA